MFISKFLFCNEIASLIQIYLLDSGSWILEGNCLKGLEKYCILLFWLGNGSQSAWKNFVFHGDIYRHVWCTCIRLLFFPFKNHHGGRISFSEKSAACGRLVCDVKISARELIRCRSYDLTELTSQILKQKRTELDYDQIKNMYWYDFYKDCRSGLFH